jgi:hypothetical protein
VHLKMLSWLCHDEKCAKKKLIALLTQREPLGQLSHFLEISRFSLCH